tara:strand:+ start:900 stop:1568 length:669 start_codon:yes stop_codon:yes gene_type:complete
VNLLKYSFFLLTIFPLIYAEKIAVATKVKGEVELMRVGKKNFIELKPGNILDDGDKIRTGRSGFTSLIFIDDKSTLKLKENSEVVVNGQRTAASISKKINLDGGIVRATIKKQNIDFVIQTPTSVASVKGTDFWLLSDLDGGDQIIGLEGLIGLVNLETGQEVDVTVGMTGLSTPDGQVTSIETDPNSIPSDPSADQEGPSQVRIYLEDTDGNQKVLIIDYQ